MYLPARVPWLCMAMLLSISMNCRSEEAQASGGIPLSTAIELVRSVGASEGWSIESYPLPFDQGHFLIEAYQKKKIISSSLCASQLVSVEILRQAHQSSFMVVHTQSENLIAFKACADSSVQDFRGVSGSVNLAELPALFRTLQAAAHCIEKCSEWASVDIEDRLKKYLERIDSKTFFNITENQGDLTLFFRFDDLPLELLACYIQKNAEGKRILHVGTEPIDVVR